MTLVHQFTIVFYWSGLTHFSSIMAEKNALSTERQRRTEQSQCRICGSPAFYSYFSVISCEACKVFFRRHAQSRHVCSIIFKKFDLNIICLERSKMCLQWSMWCERIYETYVYSMSTYKMLWKRNEIWNDTKINRQ